MKIVVAENYEDMSNKAAQIIIDKVKHNPSSVLGLATGSTPKKTYQLLIEDHNNNQATYQNIHTVNLDEYVGPNPDNPNSYHYFMNENLFKSIDIPKEQTHIPNGLASNLQEECNRYESLIMQLGGIDLQLLGIGVNGHIGFNEPGTSFETGTHVIKLTNSTRKANARFFTDISEVPTHAITMGIKSILKSKEILLLASGEKKANAIKQLVEGPIDEQFPASILKKHPNVTVIADKAALSLLKNYLKDQI
ncbi:glucosamine-6-phosphate deaminase [Peribacillus asahii]|uniref:glucosamine-6-phosphate deaminase n=1 Tax=Peribacillus asahii TaxID=228899 RepID=UPI00382E96F1